MRIAGSFPVWQSAVIASLLLVGCADPKPEPAPAPKFDKPAGVTTPAGTTTSAPAGESKPAGEAAPGKQPMPAGVTTTPDASELMTDPVPPLTDVPTDLSDVESPDQASTGEAAADDEEMAADESETDTVVVGEDSDPESGAVMLGSSELFAGIPGEGDLTIEQIKAWLEDEKNHEPLDYSLPLGMAAGAGQEKGLEENPLTLAKIELGRQLYFDPRLSIDQTISCASCHDPDEGFSRKSQFGIGVKDQAGGRNSPVAYNRIFSDNQFWDGRAGTLEDQAVGPIANPIEMGFTHDACVLCLQEIEGYRIQFEKIFGELTIDSVGKALASFERAIVTGPTPFDYYETLRPFEQFDESDIEDFKEDDPDTYARYQEAKTGAEAHPMSEEAKRGRDLFFGKANCTACHVGPNLSDEKFHNLGVGMDKPEPDIGRAEVTGEEKDTGAFKTPTIRNVALSGPYMHDGSQKTLAEVVEWYDKGGHPNPYLSDKIKPLKLSEQEKADLVAFMEACTGEFPKIERGRLPPEVE